MLTTLACIAATIVAVIVVAVLYALAVRRALSTISEWEDEDQ